VGSALAREEVDGRHLLVRADRAAAPRADAAVHVLQNYDEYVVAYTESRDVINLAGRVFTAANSTILIQPIVLDSQMVGHWRRVVERRGITARLTLAVTLTAKQRRAVEAAFARHAQFVGVPVTVDWP